VLLTVDDVTRRSHYRNAQRTFAKLLELGVVPIVNENDTVATDEIRFGDNDRLAALVANLIEAKMLLLLTDADGVHRADPRSDPDAPVLDEVERITPELERAAGGRGSSFATGGMSSKVAAAWVATFSGVGVVVANASDPEVLSKVAAGDGVGTYFHPRAQRISARRLWIAFAQPPAGTIRVDEGARTAVVERKKSLLPAGVVGVDGDFPVGATVDVATSHGVFARGPARYSSQELAEAKGLSTDEFRGREVIQRDHLVVLE
jgi:glutamate 5-kinase